MVATLSFPPEYRATGIRSNHRPPKEASRHRLWSVKSQPVDSDELTRRLDVVLAEQKALADNTRHTGADTKERHCPASTDAAPLPDVRETSQPRRHRAKDGERPHRTKLCCTASKSSTGSSPLEGEHDNASSSYRHVPQVAASQFALTTTVNRLSDKLLAHKLSRSTIKLHLSGPCTNRDISVAKLHAGPLEQAQAVRRAQKIRGRQHGRTEFRYTSTLATMPEVDDQPTYRPTLELYFRSKTRTHGDQAASRRESEGAIVGSKYSPPLASSEMPPGLLPGERRDGDIVDPSEHHPVDWTQSDEERAQLMPVATLPHPPQKPVSRWALRGRLGSLTRQGKDEKLSSPPDERQESPNSPRSGFFARFKG